MKNSIEKLLVAFASVILSTSGAFAAKQDMAQVSGSVIEKATGEPVGWATVALIKADSTLVSGTACDGNGVYGFQTQAGSYIMKVSMLGYRDFTKDVILKAGDNTLDPVQLDADNTIAGAVLTEKVKLVEMKMDKIVMNVSQSAFAQGSNALELIRKAPGVTIDKDGNIKLNGKNVSVWIDGRPSYADGKSLEAILRSTNGESIDKFEIMEHPSAKYDASGQGGIINIKTKKNMLAGLNGSMGLGGGGMHFKEIGETPWQESYWANLSYRTGKTNTFLNVYEGSYDTDLKIVNDLTLPKSDLHQIGNSVLLDRYFSYNVKFGNDWFINDRNTLGFIFYMPGNRQTMKSKSSVMDQWIAGQKVNSSSSVIDNLSRSAQYTTNLNFTHVFDEKRSAEITANLDWYRNNGTDHNTQENSTDLLLLDSRHIANEEINTDRIYDIYSAKADYQTVLAGKFMLEAGAKWALSVTDNSTVELSPDAPDNNIDFKYREHVGAAYASFSGQFGRFSAKAGLRGEYTNSFGDWISAGDQTRRSYFDLFPTVYLGYMAGNRTMLSASYTRRIERPDYGKLNPTRTSIDPRTFIVGNPDILPQYGDEASLTVNYNTHYTLALSYSHTGNMVSQIPSYTDDGLQYYTWGNFGSTNMGVAALSIASLPLAEWMQWTMSLTGIYLNNKNSLYNVNSNGLTFQGYTSFSFILPKDWKVELDGQGISSMRLANYRIHPYFRSDLAVKKSFMDNRLQLSVSCTDLFRSFKNDLDMIDESGNGAFTVIRQKYYNQKVVLDLTWSFGKGGQNRQRKVGNLEEMSRATGSNSLN